MKIEDKSTIKVKIILPEGRLDAQASEELEQNIETLIEEGCTRMVANLDRVEYISSSGLRVLLASLKKLRKNQGDLKLVCLKPYVMEIFEIAGFTNLFEIYDQEDEAIIKFKGN